MPNATQQQRRAKPTEETSPNTKREHRAEEYRAVIKARSTSAREAARRRTSPSPPPSPIKSRSSSSSRSVSPKELGFEDKDLESDDGGKGDQEPRRQPNIPPQTSPQRPTDNGEANTGEETHNEELEPPLSILSRNLLTTPRQENKNISHKKETLARNSRT